MALALLLARLLLAGVFSLAALTKLRGLAGFRESLRGFGLPDRLAAPVALLLPFVELAAAVALVPLASAWVGGLAVLALLVLFVTVVGGNLIRGKHPACNCFGQLSPAPISWRTLARNIALGSVAGFLVIAGRHDAGLDAFGWLRGGSDAMAWIMLGLTLTGVSASLCALWVLLQLVAQNGRLLTRLDALEANLGKAALPTAASPLGAVAEAAGIPVGTPAPSFALAGLQGEILTLDELRSAGKRVLLAFTDPGCGPCNALLPDVGRWQRELAATVTLAVITRGSLDENRDKSSAHGLTHVLLQKDREVAGAYPASQSPSAVLISPDGRIESPLAQGADQIRALVARATAGHDLLAALPRTATPSALARDGAALCPHCGQYHAERSAPGTLGPRPGEPAPALKLPALDGLNVDLADYRGRETVLLFWNPGCGYCQQMVPELKAWEANRPKNAPALLIVSTGSREANEAHGLASTIVLDATFNSASTFGATGTPSAVLVDRDGRISSSVAVGSTGVMALVNAND